MLFKVTVKQFALIFVVLQFRQLSDNKQEVDDVKVR